MNIYLVQQHCEGGSDTPYGPECEWDETVAAFSTREDAERYAEAVSRFDGDMHIEEYELDKCTGPYEGIWCTMFENGQAGRPYYCGTGMESNNEDGHVSGNPSGGICHIYTFARNKDDALKKSLEICGRLRK